MKKLLLPLVVLFLCTSMSGQKTVNKFIDKMKEKDHAYAVTLPGWLIRTGINLAAADEMKFERGFKDLVDGIKKLRVLYIDEHVTIDNSKLNSVVNQIKEKDGFVDYATVREDGNLVRVIVKEDGSKIKNLVLVANSDDGFTILTLKTDIEMEELKNARLSFNKSKETEI